jgi:hypothetical protein
MPYEKSRRWRERERYILTNREASQWICIDGIKSLDKNTEELLGKSLAFLSV